MRVYVDDRDVAKKFANHVFDPVRFERAAHLFLFRKSNCCHDG